MTNFLRLFEIVNPKPCGWVKMKFNVLKKSNPFYCNFMTFALCSLLQQLYGDLDTRRNHTGFFCLLSMVYRVVWWLDALL